MDRGSLGLYLRSALFAILLPGTVVVFVPVRLSSVDWRFASGTWRTLGIVPLLFGVPLLLWCIAEFARRGRGTLAPVDPPRTVVRTGAYRFTRNPMYVGVLSIPIGETLVTASTPRRRSLTRPADPRVLGRWERTMSGRVGEPSIRMIDVIAGART